MRNPTNFLYKLARKVNDFTTLVSFNPFKIIKRISNKFIGRNLLKRIFWN